MKVKFLGASETVTGSKTLLEFGDVVMLVDCGLYQGNYDLEAANDFFPGPLAGSIDYIFLTHAHLDHCGLLPKLVLDGFKGKIFCTEPTKKLVQIILEDSAKIQEYELKEKIRNNLLYDLADVERTMSLIQILPLNKPHEFEDFSAEYFEAGHILGAASLVITADEKKICFSGDIGRNDDLIHNAVSIPPDLDYLILETTYGDRLHNRLDRYKDLVESIKRVKGTKGVLLIPAFAVARTQVLIQMLWQVFEEYKELQIPVYVDSSMGVKATNIYEEYQSHLKIGMEEFEAALKRVKLIEFGKDHKRMAKKKPPFILISSSGMLNGGKILKYIDMYAHHEKNTILLTGFQGEGTLGRSLREGLKEIQIMGRKLPVRADIRQVSSLSAHGDQSDLTSYILACPTLKKVFLNHGEAASAQAFKTHLEKKSSVESIVVKLNDEFELL